MSGGLVPRHRPPVARHYAVCPMPYACAQGLYRGLIPYCSHETAHHPQHPYVGAHTPVVRAAERSMMVGLARMLTADAS